MLTGGMDVPRKNASRNRMIKRVVLGAVVVTAVSLASLGVKQMKPAAPVVERATVWPDTVKRGPMLREVQRSWGRLVPEDILVIAAQTRWVVDRFWSVPAPRWIRTLFWWY